MQHKIVHMFYITRVNSTGTLPISIWQHSVSKKNHVSQLILTMSSRLENKFWHDFLPNVVKAQFRCVRGGRRRVRE